MKRKISALIICALMLAYCFAGTGSAYADDDQSTSTNEASVTSGETTTEYATLSLAITAASSGDTVKLLKDVTIAGDGTNPYLTIEKDITLDLDGNTLTIEYDSNYSYSNIYSGNYNYYRYFFYVTGNLTIENGEITDARSNNNKTFYWCTFCVPGDASLTLTDVTLQAYRPYYVTYNNTLIYAVAESASACPVVNLCSGTSLGEIENEGGNSYEAYKNYCWVNGVILMGYKTGSYESQVDGDGSTLNVEDGVTINVSGYCISGNANYPGTTINITGGTLTSNYDLAIYHPQDGTLNISGGTLTAYDGYSAIEMRAGTLNVTGGTIKAVEDEFFSVVNGGGSCIYGAGIAIAQHTTKQAVTVNISGDDTCISGYYALYEANVQSNDKDSISKVSIHVDNGTFFSIGQSDSEDIQAVYSEDCTNFICHGTFISTANEDLDTKYVTENPCSGGTPIVITDNTATYVHSIEAVNAAEATCLEDGCIAHYECTYETCDAVFLSSTQTDEDGSETTIYEQVDESEIVIPATGHNWDEPEWTWEETDDGYTVTATFICLNDSSHIYTETASVTVSTNEDGSTVYTAVVEGPDDQEYSDERTVAGTAEDTEDEENEEDDSKDAEDEGSSDDQDEDTDVQEDTSDESDSEDAADSDESGTSEDDSEDTADGSVETGDAGSTIFWMVILAAALSVLAAAKARSRKRI